MIKIEMERTAGDFGFEVKDENGHTLQTDTSKEYGDSEYGLRPMQLLLAGLGSCSAINIIAILKKQRQTVERFSINIEGEREKDKIPSLWKNITLSFHLSGAVDKDKAEKAAALSIEKYCSVAETLRRAGAAIQWNVTVNP